MDKKEAAELSQALEKALSGKTKQSLRFDTPKALLEWIGSKSDEKGWCPSADTAVVYLNARKKAIDGGLNPPTPTGNAEQDLVTLQQWCKNPEPTQVLEDNSAWVKASTLWRGSKIKSNKQLTSFRQKHPDMFRNPSPNRLEIHAAKWTEFWAKQNQNVFDSLDESMPSVADDPNASEEFIAGAAQRASEIRKEKAGKQ